MRATGLALFLVLPAFMALSADAKTHPHHTAVVRRAERHMKRGCTDGQISCPGARSWQLCANGNPIDMGAVAAGTACRGNALVAEDGAPPPPPAPAAPADPAAPASPPPAPPAPAGDVPPPAPPPADAPPPAPAAPPADAPPPAAPPTIPPPAGGPSNTVLYGDTVLDGGVPPPPESIKGWNNYLMAFWTAGRGALDEDQQWTQLTDDQRTQTKAAYNAAGIRLMASAFGATETPKTSGVDPTKAAQDFGGWLKQFQLDGADIDFEDFDSVNNGGDEWLATFTKELRAQLPAPFIITHAPLAPWFGTGSINMYTKFHMAAGDAVDWYNVQFYNQGIYLDCTSLLFTSGGAYPGTSLFEIAAAGVDINKLVIGKPAKATDANNGMMEPAMLADCVSQAAAKGWKAGISVWQAPTPAGWIDTVRGTSF